MHTPQAKKLKSGAYRCQVMVDGQRISVTRDTEKAAVAEAMALRAGLIQTMKTPVSDLSLTKAIDKWMDLHSEVLSPSTRRGYRHIQNKHFMDLMHRKCSIITDTMIAHSISMESKKYSGKTVTNYWRFVKQVLTWSTGKQYHAALPQVIPAQREFLDCDQISLFLEAVKGDPIEIAALLALSSLRRSELAALRWEDVDLNRGVLHVRGAVVEDEEYHYVRKATTKNISSHRDVPIIEPLRLALESVEKKEGAVVQCYPSSIAKRINRVCAGANLPQVGCHGLRHSFASLCEHLQVPPRIAMEIGGWSDRTTMEKIYTHVAQKDKAYYQNAFTKHFQSGAQSASEKADLHTNLHTD